MLRLAADENFNGRIQRALQRQVSGLDLVRVQDTHLYQADDASVLTWASEEERVLLTHDISTLVGIAYDRILGGSSIAGVVAVPTRCPIGQAIEDLTLLIQVAQPEELVDRILFLPL